MSDPVRMPATITEVRVGPYRAVQYNAQQQVVVYHDSDPRRHLMLGGE